MTTTDYIATLEADNARLRRRAAVLEACWVSASLLAARLDADLHPDSAACARNVDAWHARNEQVRAVLE